MNKVARHYYQRMLENLRSQMDPDLDQAEQQLREFIEGIGAKVDEAAMREARAAIEIENNERTRLIRDPYILARARPDWYDESRCQGIHWPALANYLENTKGWGASVVGSISSSSYEIVSRLGDPSTNEFDVRGLVVGYVQSGKTANMTAVIARAVDAGYNLVVVLAGTTDTLRHQTQVRLEEDLLSRNPYNWHKLTIPNTYDSSGQIVESGDYRGQPARKLPLLKKDIAMVAVMKKHPARVKVLIDDIRASDAILKNRLRMLVIDDEADQAGLNAARTDEDPTVTNRRIRELLQTLPTVSYVGYTATPFANVLVRPGLVQVIGQGEEDSEKEYWESLEDLYPRDFIISLPRPEGYFGTEQIFGRDPVDAEDEEVDGLDVVRTVSEEEAGILSSMPDGVKIDELPALKASIQWFLLACAARMVRGHQNQHMTMLVHTSSRIQAHGKLADLVEAHVKELRIGLMEDKIIRELERIWEEESRKVDAEAFGNKPVSFYEVRKSLPAVFQRLSLAVENSASENRLSYEGDPSSIIAIGGTILSRGLTLQGLTVSCFTRRSRQYDTLLQMGRWFGYREGYEDLVRLWMPHDLESAFRNLALIEHELREEIEEYAERNATPLDFAVRIRTLPGLQVTARNKMRHARTASIDYRGQHKQTIRFPRLDAAVLEANWEAGAVLVEKAGLSAEQVVGEVDVNAIVEFFDKYQVHASHRDLSSGWIQKYIMNNKDRLSRWSLAIVQPEDTSRPVAEKRLGSFAPRLVRRARLKGSDDAIADIKALMSRRDAMIDVPEDKRPPDMGWAEWDWARIKKWREDNLGARPLLLLYPIDRISAPVATRTNSMREALDAVHDVLGLGIVFPMFGVDAGHWSTRYIQVDLSAIQDGDADE